MRNLSYYIFSIDVSKNKMMNSKRLEEIDIMKGIAIILVVMGHVLSWAYNDFLPILRQDGWDYNQIVLWKFIYSFHMPLFVFVSGLVAFNPAKEYHKVDILKRLITYLVPFFVVSLMLFLYRGGNLFSLWYFRTLAEFVIILFILEKITNKMFGHFNIYSAILIIFLFIAFFKCFGFLMKNYPALDYIFDRGHIGLARFFIFGWFIRRYPIIKRYIVNDYVFAVSAIFEFVYLRLNFYASILPAIVGIIFVLNLSNILVNTRYSKCLTFLGHRTMEIYAFHLFFTFSIFEIGDFFISEASVNFPSAVMAQLIYAILFSAIAISLVLILGTLIKKSRLLSFFLLGDTTLIAPLLKR